jgi:hypothetical protein
VKSLFNPNNELHMSVFTMQCYPFEILTGGIVNYSTGLMSFMSIGIITYQSKNTKSYLPEHPLVICG